MENIICAILIFIAVFIFLLTYIYERWNPSLYVSDYVEGKGRNKKRGKRFIMYYNGRNYYSRNVKVFTIWL